MSSAGGGSCESFTPFPVCSLRSRPAWHCDVAPKQPEIVSIVTLHLASDNNWNNSITFVAIKSPSLSYCQPAMTVNVLFMQSDLYSSVFSFMQYTSIVLRHAPKYAVITTRCSSVGPKSDTMLLKLSSYMSVGLESNFRCDQNVHRRHLPHP